MTLSLSKHLSKAIKQLDSSNKLLSIELANSIKDKIKNQTENWKPLKQKTKDNKPGKTKNKILFHTGSMLRSIKGISSNYKIFVGTIIEYARIHNEGGRINKTVSVKSHSRKRKGKSETVKSHSRKMNLTIPKREFLFLGKSEESIIDAYAKRVIT